MLSLRTKTVQLVEGRRVGAPAVVAQPEPLIEERADGAGLVESVVGRRVEGLGWAGRERSGRT